MTPPLTHDRTGGAPAAADRPHEGFRGRGLWVVAAMALGVLAISTASVLIRLAEASPLAVGGWRLLLAWLLLTPVGWPARSRT